MKVVLGNSDGEQDNFAETYKARIGEQVHSWYIPLKTTFDFFCALILLVLTSPIILIAAIAIKLETPGPVFYRQERVGLMGKHIVVTKLRSMGTDAEKMVLSGPIRMTFGLPRWGNLCVRPELMNYHSY